MEMYAFQKFCYDAPLQPQALDSVKDIIQRNCQDGVFNNGITLSGMFLTCIFILLILILGFPFVSNLDY